MRLVLFGATLVAMFVAPAFAHPATPGHIHSFADGILHPLSGADHVFAMASVGLWGAMVGGRAIWVWPASFMVAMLAGFAAALLGLQTPIAETAVSASIVVLGLLVAVGVKAPLALGAAIVGLFAFFHGHAHGIEATAANLLTYAAGFTFSTGTLHAVGIVFGLCVRSLQRMVLAPMGRLQSAVRGDGGPR
jgi:urease accessory protein